jgi:putative tryptophan/tyrosine transport system substrate-binding protein
MRRREVIGLVGAAAASVLPGLAAAPAQTVRKPRRIAFVHSGFRIEQLTEAAGPFWVRRFYETLRSLGDVEGGNLAFERYSAEGRAERFASLASEVVSSNPEVIVTNLNDLAKAFQAATSTIPIVAITGDPVAAGLISSLAHPAGNLTGVSIDAGIAIFDKRLQILKEAMPHARRATYLLSSAQDGRRTSAFSEAAQQMGIVLTLDFLSEISEAALRRVFAGLSGAPRPDRGAGGELSPARDLSLSRLRRCGLMTYAPDLDELAQRLARDVHQILGGTKPGDIPYYQPTKFLLIINLKAARTIGLDLPATQILRADEVIE